MTTDVFPPTQIYTTNSGLKILEISGIVCGNQVNLIIQITNYGTNNLTSATIKYNLNTGPQTVMNWTGNLSQNQSIDLNIGNIPSLTGANTINAILENPNGTIDQFISDNNASVSFNIAPDYQATQLNFELNTDDFGNETSWSVNDTNGAVIARGANYASNSIFNQTINLPSDGCYTFQINDTNGGGICCGFGTGSYSLRTANNVTIIQGSNFGAVDIVKFGAYANLSTQNIQSSNPLKVYPNPSAGIYNLNYDGNATFDYEVYNLLVQSITKGNVNSKLYQIDLSQNPSGIYLLRVKDLSTNDIKSFKLVKE